MRRTLPPVGLKSHADTTICATALGAVALLMSGAVHAQGLQITPSIALSETLTDNRSLSSTNPSSDLITQVSPGLSISARRGALQGSLVYALNGLAYARESSLNNVYHSLAGRGTLSLLDGRMGVDASASAGRQVISAYGTQASDANLVSGNQAQVYTYSLAPYLRGKMLGDVSYETRVVYAQTQSATSGTDSNVGSSVGDSKSMDATAGLRGHWGRIGWALDGTRTISESGTQPRAHNGRVFGTLSHQPDVEVQLSLRLGTEVDDRRTGLSERTTTWGGTLVWSPGPRTTATLEYDRRFFGNSHLISLSHRMANTIWSISDSRSLDTGGALGRSVVSLYDQLFAQSASLEPDPIKRDVLVRNQLAASGQDGSSRVVVGGFLSNGSAAVRTQQASVAYRGLLTTASLAFNRTQSVSIGQATGGDDLSRAGDLRQQGVSLSLSYRLTPASSFVFTASQQRTLASGPQAGNDLRSIVGTWSATLGTYTNVSLGVRHSNFDSDINPYQESAVLGSIRMQF